MERRRRTRSDFLFLFMSSCLAISLLFASPRFVQNSYKCRARFIPFVYGGCAFPTPFPLWFPLPSLLVCTHLSIRMHHPSIHPTIGSASYFPYPATLYFSFFYSAVCRSCWCWIIDAQLLLLRCHQDGRICSSSLLLHAQHSPAAVKSFLNVPLFIPVR
jgi:hypothetical protein